MKVKDAIGNFRFVDNWYSYSVNETDSRREFLGSRILTDLWPDHINEFIELIQSAGQRIWSWGVVTIFGKTPNMYLFYNPEYVTESATKFDDSSNLSRSLPPNSSPNLGFH